VHFQRIPGVVNSYLCQAAGTQSDAFSGYNPRFACYFAFNATPVIAKPGKAWSPAAQRHHA
jgi:hypothetical protein